MSEKINWGEDKGKDRSQFAMRQQSHHDEKPPVGEQATTIGGRIAKCNELSRLRLSGTGKVEGTMGPDQFKKN